jgi:hypothetical protein
MSCFDWNDNEVVVVHSYGDIAIYIIDSTRTSPS